VFHKDFEGPNGAELLVQCLESAGVTHIFGIPGAKIDPLFEALVDSSIELIVCRHEQNAGFMAAAMGRITGRPGVCIGTSGPGTSNFCTAMITATTEGDPVVCLTGAVPRRMRHQKTHQSMDNVAIMRPVTKYAQEAESTDAIPELIAAAFKEACAPRKGASYLSLPYDVMLNEAHGHVLPTEPPPVGAAPSDLITQAAAIIAGASNPVLIVGMAASEHAAAGAIRSLLRARPIPIVGTWEAAGVVPRDCVDSFFGRVGLFRNQPGDLLLDNADVIVTLGFNPVEYDPSTWNASGHATLVHIDEVTADPDEHYRPKLELIGDLAATITALHQVLPELPAINDRPSIEKVRVALANAKVLPKTHSNIPIHPLEAIRQLQLVTDDHGTVICDVGSLYIWMGRHFMCYEPRHLLFSNGQQTLGVALPWAISACLARPNTTVLSMSGDGGFLFSAQELETAVRLGCNFTHIVWRDGRYDMVAFQQRMKYGRDSGVDFGEPDIVAYAEAFGATGLRLEQADQLSELVQQGMNTPGPVLIDMPVDYSDNDSLAATMQDIARWH
jgi:acetolactate synthase-1/2/3 large subunit